MQTTLYEVCRKILEVDAKGKALPKSKKSITVGFHPKKNLVVTPDTIHFLTVEEILGVWIDVLDVDGDVTGYQRKVNPTQARKMARARKEGRIFPAVFLALDEDGRVWCVDGQHRLIAGVIAQIPVRADIHAMNEDLRRQVFIDQDRGTRISRQHHILAGKMPSELFMQDAVTCGENSWSTWVTYTGEKNKIPVTTAHDMVVSYVTKSGGFKGRGAGTLRDNIDALWEEHYADELAELLTALGTKESNPIAFRAHALRGVTRAATDIIRNNGSEPKDIKRWHRVIGSIRWNDYGHLHKSNEFRRLVIEQWNKRLTVENKIPVPFD